MESADTILGETVVRPLMNQVECHLKERQVPGSRTTTSTPRR